MEIEKMSMNCIRQMDMENELISVIVPVYNVSRYIDRCMTSLLKQTYENIEIILVDDGSPDDCGFKCDQYARTDSRVYVIHKKNAGLGMARNSGLDIAKGKYVAFIDSDDYVDEQMFERLYMAFDYFTSGAPELGVERCQAPMWST